MKYKIGSIPFKSKEACKTYTRNIISSLGCGTVSQDSQHFGFFADLLQNHSAYEEKCGSGIKYFIVGKNQLSPKHYEMRIKRTDDSEETFSWIYCCEFKPRTDHLFRSMRSAVRHHVIQFKESHPLVCNDCKRDDMSYEEYHVDHDNPSFQTLRNTFLGETKRAVPTMFGRDPNIHLTIFREEDSEFENEWLTYHNTHCNLQMLCGPCNLKKGKT